VGDALNYNGVMYTKMSNLNEILTGQAKEAIDTKSLVRGQENEDIQKIASILSEKLIHSIQTGSVRTEVYGDTCTTIVRVSKRIHAQTPFIESRIKNLIYETIKNQLSEDHTVSVVLYSDKDRSCIEINDDCIGCFSCFCCLPLLCMPFVCCYDSFKSSYPLWTVELTIERKVMA
jgi:hypothetical protein